MRWILAVLAIGAAGICRAEALTPQVEIEEEIRSKQRAALVHARELSALFFSTYVLAALLWKFISLLTY